MPDSLTVTDDASAAVAIAPRVSKADIEAKIARVSYVNLAKATGQLVSASASLRVFTLCVLEMQNGFIVIGESAPASPENYDEQLGEQFSYENAFRKLWPIEGYLLRERLYLGHIEAIASAGSQPQPEPAPQPIETVTAADNGPATLDGGAGSDSVTADAGADTVTGDAGADSATAPAEADPAAPKAK